jgi:hypothetical protein
MYVACARAEQNTLKELARKVDHLSKTNQEMSASESSARVRADQLERQVGQLVRQKIELSSASRMLQAELAAAKEEVFTTALAQTQHTDQPYARLRIFRSDSLAIFARSLARPLAQTVKGRILDVQFSRLLQILFRNPQLTPDTAPTGLQSACGAEAVGSKGLCARTRNRPGPFAHNVEVHSRALRDSALTAHICYVGRPQITSRAVRPMWSRC